MSFYFLLRSNLDGEAEAEVLEILLGCAFCLCENRSENILRQWEVFFLISVQKERQIG